MQQQRDKIVSDMRQLRKLNRTLESSSMRIGKSNDTTSWRKTFNYDLEKGVQLVLSLQTSASRIRSQSMHEQDKLIAQSQEPINKFNEIKAKIDEKLATYDPVDDIAPTLGYDNDGNAYGNAGGNVGSYVAPSQQQQQIEDVGLVPVDASLASDLDNMRKTKDDVVKVCFCWIQ